MKMPLLAFLTLVVCLATAVAPSSVGAQRTFALKSSEGVSELAEQCATGRPAQVTVCQEVAITAMVLQQQIGLASSLGSDAPGSSSTLGRRLGKIPRVSLSVSAATLRSGVPYIAGSLPGNATDRKTVLLPSLRVDGVAGLLNGFQLGSGVGGILSVDVVGSYSFLRLPAGPDIDGSRMAYGVGARVGLLRESFIVPGVSVSAMRRWHGVVSAGSVKDGSTGEAETDIQVSSLRAVAGKNWFAIGLMGGVGWDHYKGDARVAVALPSDAAVAEGEVSSQRILYFASGWFNFLVTRFSAELGVAQGVDDPFTNRVADFDVATLTWFASVSFRVTL